MSDLITGRPTGFFAYASLPHAIPATIKNAVEDINKTQRAFITTWEDLATGGKYIVPEICEAIQDADFFCADLTTINPNVMFELGFAITRDKRIWLVRDDTYVDSKKEFEQLRLLTTIGYRSYTNSEHILRFFFADSPHQTPEETIFRSSIEPTLGPHFGTEELLYLRSKHDTEASLRVSRVLNDLTPRPIVDDPRESAVQALYWYGQTVYRSGGVVAHFLSSSREGSRLINARYALVCGLARGFDIPILMLTEQSELLAPMDYRDEMRHYTTPAEAGRIVQQWLEPFLTARKENAARSAAYSGAVRLATELKDFHLTLGEYVAENEADRLPAYFVETTAHMDVINGTQTIFVGRKGTGKSATLIEAAYEIGKDATTLVCVIKPVGYEMDGLLRLFNNYKLSDHKGYVIESLWKYMIYTEIAIAARAKMTGDQLWQLSSPSSKDLVELLDHEKSALTGDFTVRLERAITSLAEVNSDASDSQIRQGISEALHSNILGRLRSALIEILRHKRQVTLLVDNLDKPWLRSANFGEISQFLLGLLTAAARVGEELKYGERGKSVTRYNSAIFLRSDIFDSVVRVAREPDKLSYTRLAWDDSEMLLRVIEERYIASHGAGSDPSTMWRQYFCEQVRGVPTREYLTSRILPRPRDVVYFVKAAVSFAVNRKHNVVEEKDILDAEKQYSQYAWDSILVENGISVPQLESVLLEFVGCTPILSASTVLNFVSKAGIEAEKVDGVVSHLVSLTFLGLEVDANRFVYSDEAKQLKKNTILAERYAGQAQAEARCQINTPFRAYLEIKEEFQSEQLF